MMAGMVLNVPGFIFDDAKIEEWTAWQDYAIGTLVKYKQYFYVAKNRVVGNSTFQDKDFVILNDKPKVLKTVSKL